MTSHVPLSLLLFGVLAVPALRAQGVPCLGNGSAPNASTRWDDSPVGHALRAVDQLQNESSPQTADLYRGVLAAAENLPDTDTCKARALFYVVLYYKHRDPDKALGFELRSVAIADSVLPVGHPRRVLDARDLAGFYDTAHKPAEAERFYRQALSLADSTDEASVLRAQSPRLTASARRN